MIGFEFPPLTRLGFSTLQFNIGRLCNQACLHCHVESSPSLTGAADNASAHLVDQVIALLEQRPEISTLDLTGGAPELNPHFRRLVLAARELQCKVLVRHNLTVQGEEGQNDLPQFFADNDVELFCSLPCYLKENVNSQRGSGVFSASIDGLRALNAAGYAQALKSKVLHLVFNPQADSLPPAQQPLEDDYRRVLREEYDIEFSDLLTITNQPIHRFEHFLQREGKLDSYMQLLRDNYNPQTLPSLMCRTAISLRWDGKLFDCDFNLVKALPMTNQHGTELTITDLFTADHRTGEVAIADHCFACTAGSGSSCAGSLVQEV
ncbi:MAG: arsenosugar biosynthesis radical SAM protein ArsS [Planctomycetes bacterium]|nr:arsenosugar biosynthesis radical SAM protein ArsS [Planctomycetota bacterium]